MAQTWQLHIPIDEETRAYWRKRAKLLKISPAELVGRILTEVHFRGSTSLGEMPQEDAIVTSRSAPSGKPDNTSVAFQEFVEGRPIPVENKLQGKRELFPESHLKDFDFKKCPAATVRQIFFQESREELFSELITKYTFPGDFLDEECLLCYGKFIDLFKWMTTQEEKLLVDAKSKRAFVINSWKKQREEISNLVSEANVQVELSQGRERRIAKVKYRSLLTELRAFEEKTRWHLREW